MDVDAESLHKYPFWHVDEYPFTIKQIQHILAKESLQRKAIFKSGWSTAGQEL